VAISIAAKAIAAIARAIPIFLFISFRHNGGMRRPDGQ
jgi:hypothetical protein